MGTYIVDIVAMFFGMPMALFPAAATHLGGAGVLGLLYAAPAVGSLLATATSGWAAHVHRHGAAVCVAAAGWGVGIIGFGLAPNLGLALLGLVVAGGADMVSGIFRGTIWNQTIPDHLRGRLAGIEMLSYSIGPLAGQVRAGLVADRWSVRGAIISGGVSCVAGVTLTAAWLHDFWRYDSRTDVHAVAEREARAQAHGEPA
jgi:MFS family permease